MMDHDAKNGQWFANLLLRFTPQPEDIKATGTPEEMIDEAAKKAFWVSTTLSAAWGPAGLATIFPEIISLVKIQMNLVYKIAHYHHKRHILNHTAILLIFANALGLAIGPLILHKIGTRLVIKSLSLPLINMIARKIGLAIAVKISQRVVGRWVPILLAPVFGLFSKRMTRKIGREANLLFDDAFFRLPSANM
jgi:hypothetical protein